MIFGSISSSDPSATVVVLVVTIATLFIIGWQLSVLKDWIECHRYSHIFENIERSLLQLGIISFGLFLFNPAHYGDSVNDEMYGQAFELTHIIVLFLMLVFAVEAITLLYFCISADRSFLVAINSDASALYKRYQEMIAAGKWENYLFHKSSFWASSLVSLRTQIEFKIIQRLFIRIHKLPTEFSFSKYSVHLFKVFVAEIGDAASLSWIVFLLLCVINFFRLEVIDPPLMKSICDSFYTTTTTTIINGTAISYDVVDEEECSVYYSLSFASFMMFFLVLFVYIAFTVTCTYFDSLIHKSLLVDNIDFTKSGRYGYKRVLEAMQQEDDELQDNVEKQLNFHLEEASNVKATKELEISETLSQKQSALSSNRKFKSYREIAKEMQEIKVREHSDEYKSQAELRREASTDQTEQSSGTEKGFWYRIQAKIEHIFPPEGDLVSLDICDIFYKRSHWLYFRFVEVSLFLQCLYIALWCCQLMPLVHIAQTKHVSLAGLWVVVLTLPIFLNAYLGGQTINKAVLIRSVSSIDRNIIGVVCDEIIAEGKAVTEFRDRVRNKLNKGKLKPENWKPFVRQIFNKYDKDRNGTLNRSEFRLLLEDIDIYLGQPTFDLLWSMIDTDNSNQITWDELLIILFPEIKREIKLNLEVAKRLRKEIENKNSNISAEPTAEAMHVLKLKFNVLDSNNNGYLDKREFRELLSSLHVTSLSERNFNLLFSCIDFIAKDEAISFEEFQELIYPQTSAKKNTETLAQSTAKLSFFRNSSNISRENFRDSDGNGVPIRSSKAPVSNSNRFSASFKSPRHNFKLDDKISDILTSITDNSKSVSNENKDSDFDSPKDHDMNVKLTSNTNPVNAKAANRYAVVDDDNDHILPTPAPEKQKKKQPRATATVVQAPVRFHAVPSGAEDNTRSSPGPEIEKDTHMDNQPINSTPRAAMTPSPQQTEAAAIGFSEADQNRESLDQSGAAGPSEAITKPRSTVPRLKFANLVKAAMKDASTLPPYSDDSTQVSSAGKKTSGEINTSRSSIPESDRDDLIIFPVPKGCNELGLGLQPDHLEYDDSEETDENAHRKTIAHVRVVSIRSVNKTCKPHSSGLRANDVIYAVNGVTYESYDELIAALNVFNAPEGYFQLELSARGDHVIITKPVKTGRTSAKKKLLIKAVKKMSLMR